MTYSGSMIERFRTQLGLKLKPIAREANVDYNTLWHRISRGTDIPFEDVVAIARVLNRPLSDFVENPSPHDLPQEKSKEVRLDDFWNRLKEVDFRLDELGEIGAYVDVYEPLDATMKLPTPIAFGRLGAARKILGFESPQDYFDAVRNFDPKILDRSLACHVRALVQDFQPTMETINETVNGTSISGYYVKGTARTRDRQNRPRIAVFTEPVMSLQT